MLAKAIRRTAVLEMCPKTSHLGCEGLLRRLDYEDCKTKTSTETQHSETKKLDIIGGSLKANA